MRAVLIVAGCLLIILALGAGAWGLAFWQSALAVAPDRTNGHPIWISADIYVLAAGGFLALGLICLGLAEVLYRLPR